MVFDGPASELTDDRLIAIYHHTLDGEDGQGADSAPAKPAVPKPHAPLPEPAAVV